MPTVSVVLNCYNHAAYVAEAVESVLAQTHPDFELILIDNGSTDDTRMILSSYADKRIRPLFFDENETLSKRLNQGVAAATGEFVCILYSDDMMLPDKLERQTKIFAQLPKDYGVVYAPARRFNQFTGEEWQCPSIEVRGTMMPAILDRFSDGLVDMSSPMTRRECFVQHGWHEDLFGDGEAVFFRIALNWKFHFDEQPNVRMRDHDTNIGKAIIKNHDMFMEVCERMSREPGFTEQHGANMQRMRATVCRSSAWSALRMGSGRSDWIRTQLFAAMRQSPQSIFHVRWIAGIIFSLVPHSLRLMLNAGFRSIKGTKENSNFIEDYG